MTSKELIEELQKYDLTMIKKEKSYNLIDMKNGERFEDMSIQYIKQLVKEWNTHTI